MERSGSTLPSFAAVRADSKFVTPVTEPKSVTFHSSSIETCIGKLSTAFELLATEGTRPIAGSILPWQMRLWDTTEPALMRGLGVQRDETDVRL